MFFDSGDCDATTDVDTKHFAQEILDQLMNIAGDVVGTLLDFGH
jgi:hypothetical protein